MVADTAAVVVLLYFAAPLLLTIGTTLVTMLVVGGRGHFLKGSHIPRLLLAANLGIFALAWVLIATAPDVTTSNGQCKDLSEFGAFFVLVPGSAFVGGLAWGTASLQRDSSFARLISYAAIALAAPYAIAIRAFVAAACTWN